jgi:hypothetical protein
MSDDQETTVSEQFELFYENFCQTFVERETKHDLELKTLEK